MRSKLRLRVVLPAAVVMAVAVGGLLMSLSATAATRSQVSPAGGAASSSSSQALAAGSSGSSGSSAAGSSGSSAITYRSSFSASQIHEGAVLFETVCSTCHGTDAEGSAVAPDLQGLGPATVDFWVSTGRMPLADAAIQATQKPPRFNQAQSTDIGAFVGSLAPAANGYPTGIPQVHLNRASLSEGNSLFVLNCAACHTITGAGDALANGAYAPTLHQATSYQVAEAIRTGPGNMPVFGPGTLSNRQVADIVKYVVEAIQHPDNRGGIGLGGIGPVAEGFVALLIGVGGLMLVTYWLGERA